MLVTLTAPAIGVALGLLVGVLHGRWPTPILLLLGALLSVPVVWLMMRGEDRPGSIVMAVVAYSVTLGVVLEYRKHRRVSEA